MVTKIMQKTEPKKQLTHSNSNQKLFVFDGTSKRKNYNIKIDKDSTLIFVSLQKQNLDQNLNFFVTKNCELKVYIIDLIESSKHNFKITLNHSSDSKTFLYAKIFASKKSSVNIDVQSTVRKNEYHVITNQEIKGFLFAEDATITAIPSLIIDNNQISASHSLNVSYLDRENIFYLQTRGFDYKQAVNILIENEISILKNTYYNSKKRKIDIYKAAKNQISRMLRNN